MGDSMTAGQRSRLVRALVSGVFGMLLALALLGILIGFLALKRDDLTGIVSLIVVAVARFGVGFERDWRRSGRAADGGAP
jgi:uncharacterized membrane protein